MRRTLNVYLCGEKTGVLAEDGNANLSFLYDPAVLKKPGAPQPLSVRLPVREGAYHHQYAYPFFENLTPEGRPLEIIANKLRISENNPFSILDKIGGDCAGAVALYEGEKPSGSDEPLRAISEKDMARIIHALPDNPLLTGMRNPPRLSLAGAQYKFAVCMGAGETFFSPNDEYPSTHIIKIGNDSYKNLLHNELFCMLLAQDAGLPVPPVSLRAAKGSLYLNIARYDRHIAPAALAALAAPSDERIYKAERIHQEDFCLALGYPSGKKYQADGGPDLRKCFQAITQYSHHKITDIFSFIQWITFNYLIGNADTHAKNISFLHKNNRVILAPFYDLLSTEIYPPRLASRKIAMLINGKYQYDTIKQKDFPELYRQFGLNPLQTMKNASRFFTHFAEKTNSLKDRLNADRLTASPVYDAIFDLIKQRLSVLTAL